jgi:hypothetical protein
MSYTTRCNAEERKAFKRQATHHAGVIDPVEEPALGTLEQRLDIIFKRHGGNLRPLKPTPAERDAYALWLEQEARLDEEVA